MLMLWSSTIRQRAEAKLQRLMALMTSKQFKAFWVYRHTLDIYYSGADCINLVVSCLMYGTILGNRSRNKTIETTQLVDLNA